MEELLNVVNLEKSYKNKKVIYGISFQVSRGEILCFLGPNGAGKSTTINILTGALGYDKGSIQYNGQAIKGNKMEFKQKLGVVPQDLALYEDLSAQQNVRFFASLYGLKGRELARQSAYALEFAGLGDKGREKVKTFSGGMKRRLNIACAIAHQPELLIMDEPTVGIDPQSRNHILNGIKTLRSEGMTIIYTTHYMEEVEEISTRIIIMDNGKIIVGGTKEALKESAGNPYIVFFALSIKTQSYEDIGWFKKALALYDEMESYIRLHKGMSLFYPNYYIGIAGIYLKQMDLERALASLDAAARDADDKLPWFDRGYVYNKAEYLFLTGDNTGAMELLNHLLTLETYSNLLVISSLLKYALKTDRLAEPWLDQYMRDYDLAPRR